MTQQEKDKIIDKVKKLLALSKSSNEHEAGLALENANKLLMKHNLEMADIDEVSLSDIIEENDLILGKRIMSWKIDLLNAVMRLNGCQILMHRVRNGNKRISAIGKKHNIEVSIFMYDYLIKTMDRTLKEKQKDDVIDPFSYRMGFCSAISRKVNEILQERERNKNDFNDACTALVVLDKALVNQFMNEKYKNIKEEKSKTSYKDRMSFMQGHIAGENTGLNSQVN